MGIVRDNFATIVAGIVVAAVLVGTTVAFGPWAPADASNLMVVVHDGEGNTHQLPLGQDDSLSVSTNLGNNTITVRDGHAYMSEADCPKGDCMHQASISRPGQQLICLPHQLWAEIVAVGTTGSLELDADAVTWETDSESESGFSSDVDLVAR